MADPIVVIFYQPPRIGDPPLTRLLAEARAALLEHHIKVFRGAGAPDVRVLPGRDARADDGESFGERLARLIEEERVPGGLVVLGAGALPRLRPSDAARLLAAAGSGGRVAMTNNRHSSDVCAISLAAALRDLPALPTDNALPRWLEERAGFTVRELPDRDRLALDMDTPLDVALTALAPGAPRTLRDLASAAGLRVPRLDALRALADDPSRELLVFGRSGSRTLRWLERNARCRVRFLSEERGLRASSPLAMADTAEGGSRPVARPPRSTLGRLLASRGPEHLAETVAELADGAVIDSRVLLADRLGADESGWPSAEDRFASDLLRPDRIDDPWLRSVTAAADRAASPILLGGHSLVSPGLPLLLRRRRQAHDAVAFRRPAPATP